MSAPRAIQARYADWRPVKGRKVLQVILEVPLEQQGEVLGLLGAPLPDRDLWVAVALLADHRNENTLKGGKIAQEAGILCAERSFKEWCGEASDEGAARYVRERCNIDSRAHLDHDQDAARAFKDMKLEYQAWLRVEA